MSLYSSETDLISPLVSKVFSIKELRWGSAQLKYVMQYRGHLKINSIDAFEQLSEDLKGHSLSPLFRQEDELQEITLIESLPDPQTSNPNKNILFFLLTLFSMLIAGASYVYDGDADSFIQFYKEIIKNLESIHKARRIVDTLDKNYFNLTTINDIPNPQLSIVMTTYERVIQTHYTVKIISQRSMRDKIQIILKMKFPAASGRRIL